MIKRCAAVVVAALTLSACGSSTTASKSAATRTDPGLPTAHPQAIEPAAGAQAAVTVPSDPVGDPNAHAPPLSEIRRELKQELVAATITSATYINPLYYVTCCGRWERTDQGVDATLPVGAPILAPGTVKVLAIEPDWYAGQPLVYWELLDGPDAGRVQFGAEAITDIAAPGSLLQPGQPLARFAPRGTGIEFGWSTINGVTLARATTGYEEGQITPAGRSIRAWLNALGAKAGPDFGSVQDELGGGA